MSARRPDDETASEVLVLEISRGPAAGVHIAIRATDVREVASAERITEYPGAPADVPGITAVRGHIVAVLDLVPGSDGPRSIVLVVAGPRTLALAGGTAIRVTTAAVDVAARPTSGIPLWSGRVLPVAGTARLHDAAGPDAAAGPALPLLDSAALIRDVVDDPDGGR